MSEKPEEPYAIGEPKTLEGSPRADRPSREMENERPSLRRSLFWIAVAIVLIGGLVLYFLNADAVTPVLRTGG
jgi:hypothetical protein